MVTRAAVAPDPAAAVAVAHEAALDRALDLAPDRDHDLARADHAVAPAVDVTRAHDHAQDHDRANRRKFIQNQNRATFLKDPSLFLKNPFTPCIAGRN